MQLQQALGAIGAELARVLNCPFRWGWPAIPTLRFSPCTWAVVQMTVEGQETKNSYVYQADPETI
jgi:hypothetical protein